MHSPSTNVPARVQAQRMHGLPGNLTERDLAQLEKADELPPISERIKQCERRLTELQELAKRLEGQGADTGETLAMIDELEVELEGLRNGEGRLA